MRTPRKRITFRTPARKTKQTPAKKPTKDVETQKNNIASEATTNKRKVLAKKTPNDEILENKIPTKSEKAKKDVKLKTNKKEINKNTDYIKNADFINNTDLNEYLLAIESSRIAEQSLIKNYQNEIKMLKSLNSDTLIYQKFLGLIINEENDIYDFKWKVRDNYINFKMSEREDDYIYEFIESNLELCEPFDGGMEFEKTEFMKFFDKIFGILMGKGM